MKRGDTVEIVRYSRPGKPAAGDAPTVVRGRLVKAVSGRVWVDTGEGEPVVAWRYQTRVLEPLPPEGV